MNQRRELIFSDASAVAADVRRLRPGYTKVGNWSLPQICCHLNIAMKYSMRPGPHETPPPNPAGRAIFEGILASGKIPAGRQSPERALPPADTTETTIDEFLNTLTHFQSYSGDFAPHHMFGAPSRAEFAQFHMIHCAHHLGHLIPNS